MGYYDEDFYDEPSEFDEQIMALKESLATSIKSEFVAEMERLKAENAELQNVKRDWESIQGEYAEKHRQLEREKTNLEYKVRHERLQVLLEPMKIIRYRATSETQYGPKCDKCDERRRVKYTTPLGREAHENCECSVGKNVFLPEEYVVSEFSIDHNGKNLNVWYKKSPYVDSDSERFDSSSGNYARVIYQPGMDFKGLERWETFFNTKEECQAYCDWLNTQNTTK